MLVTNFKGGTSTTCNGLTQWDYGQVIKIDYGGLGITDGTEIHFFQGLLSSIGYLRENKARIPDIMLQNAKDITAYVYIRSDNSGETVLTIKLPVAARPRPTNYVLPQYQEYKRLLPAGGIAGQVLVKRSDMDFDAEWKAPSGGTAEIRAISREEIDEITDRKE